MSKLLSAIAVLFLFLLVAAFAYFAFTPANIEQQKVVLDVSLDNSGNNSGENNG